MLLFSTQAVEWGIVSLASPLSALPIDKCWCLLQDKDSIADPNIGMRDIKPEEGYTGSHEILPIMVPDSWY